MLDMPSTASGSLNKAAVLAKLSYFARCQLWPLANDADPTGWLCNFQDDELPHAVHLLNAVLMFRNPLMDQLFRSSFQALSHMHITHPVNHREWSACWRKFCDTVLITLVTGESPHSADSSHAFARRARDLLRIPEDRILPPEECLRRLLNNGPQPVVFVDDFVGSGNQFITTWHRSYQVGGKQSSSFASLSNLRPGPFFYIPLICTWLGEEAIRTSCPAVQLRPAHLLNERYSLLHPESLLWPEHLRASAQNFLRSSSLRAGIPDSPGSTEHYEGFASLGLSIAFEEKAPDATVPLLWWSKSSDWQPLFRRGE